jgi:hypothetical protein
VTWFGQIPFPSKETVILSRGTSCVDLFTLTSAQNVEHRRYSHATGWFAPTVFSNPVGTTLRSIAATINGTTRVELFATGANGKVYRAWSGAWATCTSGLAWVGWFEVAGAVTTTGDTRDKIAVTSWEPGRIDAFWITPAGNIQHGSSINNVWQGLESGDNGVTYLQSATTPLEAVSSRPGRIDLLFGASPIKHQWYDSTNGGWGSGTSHRSQFFVSGGGTGRDIAVAQAGSGNLDLFMLKSRFLAGQGSKAFYYLQHRPFTAAGGWGAQVVLTGTGELPSVSPGEEANQVMFNDGLNWNAPDNRREILGVQNTQAWQLTMIP